MFHYGSHFKYSNYVCIVSAGFVFVPVTNCVLYVTVLVSPFIALWVVVRKHHLVYGDGGVDSIIIHSGDDRKTRSCP